ncbi:MAG TPA: alpha-amylase family glycosyl hydrolase [Granulicella sp.]|jgi:glycosidase|nr:alpha-amylase family glycosyl hydrolase [Granulicella sp.]
MKPKHHKTPRLLLALTLAATVALLTTYAPAQTLARPGWVGSGLTTEAWWKHLVLYEIAPRGFQDSNGDGIGDLKGITQRLDYLHSLGVDAILLDSLQPQSTQPAAASAAPTDPTAPTIDPALGTLDDLDELSLQASRRDIRILLNLPQPDLATARFWLNRGIAGFRILPPTPGTAPEAAPASLQELHSLLAAAIGQRILIASPSPDPSHDSSPDSAPSARRASKPSSKASPQLLPISSLLALPTAPVTRNAAASNGLAEPTPASVAPAPAGPEAAQLRAVLSQAVAHNSQPPLPLLLSDAPEHPRSIDRFGAAASNPTPQSQSKSSSESKPEQDTAMAKLIATVLLGTDSAVLLDYGQEIGLSAAASTASTTSTTAALPAPRMPWGNAPQDPTTGFATPAATTTAATQAGAATYTTAATPPTAAAPPPPPPTDGFGAYHPYIRQPKPKAAETTATPANHFASGTVAAEDSDPRSLLNFYRQLSALHHGDTAMRDGDTLLLDHDAQNVLAWVRRPHSITPLSPALVVLCNLSPAPVTLSLKADMTRLHLRGSFLRTLLRSDTAIGTMHLDGMTLPPYAVYIGELRY